MKRIMLTVAYDGTDYAGWQWQPRELTIEEVLNRELSRLLKEEIRVKGVSRTDAGVHAEGNLCVFDTESRIPPEKFCYALNRSLPEDIVVMASREVPEGFHPRKWDSEKTYEYTIEIGRFPDPLRRRYAWTVYTPLDAAAMGRAAVCLEGEHDFASFCASGSQAESTVRRILSLRLAAEAQETDEAGRITRGRIVMRITGTGFLYNMVRIITGTLAEIGKGKRSPEEMADILAAADRRKAGPTAPPEGLCLKEIRLIAPPWERQGV